QCRLVGPGQAHLGRLAGLEGLLPARRTQAPAIAGFEAREAGRRHRGRQVVAGSLRKSEELGIDPGADGVYAEILGPRLAAAGAIEAGQRLRAAFGERLAEHVARTGAPARIGTGSIGHGLPPKISSAQCVDTL